MLTGSVVWGSLGLVMVWGKCAGRLRYTKRPTDPAKRGRGSRRPEYRLAPELGAERSGPPGSRCLAARYRDVIDLAENEYPALLYRTGRRCHDLGIFAALAYLLVAGDTVVSALGRGDGTAPGARLCRRQHSRLLWARAELTAFVAVLGVAGLGITLIAGRTILTLLYRPEYAEHLFVFVWLVAGAGLGYAASVLGYAITAARYFRIQVPLFMLVLGAAWLTCKWLIPTSGPPAWPWR